MDTPLIEIDPREAVELGAESLEMYGKLFFPKTFRQESPEFHRIIGADLYSPARYNAFSIFRDGAKTSLLRVYTSQRIAYGISRTVMYVGRSQPHAMMSLRWLRRQVMYNAKWNQTFGLRKGEKWTDEHCEIMHGIEEMPITILAMGITGQIRGFNPDDYRPDLIIIDDILDEENTGTEAQRQKIESLLFGALLNSLAPETDCPLAKAVFLQTPLHKEDALAKCLRDPQWNGRTFGVLDYTRCPEGESVWPTRYPTETVHREKAGAIARGQYHIWMREKECKVVGQAGKPLDASRVRTWEMLPPTGVRLICIDPASSDSPTADDQVVMLIQISGPDVYVIEYYADVGMMPDVTANYFFSLILSYSPQKAAVESISYQRILAWYLEEEMKKRRVFVPIDRVQDKRKKSDRIIQGLAGLINLGHLYIRPEHSKLLQQIDDYDPFDDSQHDDVIDALAIGIMSVNPAMRRSAAVIEGDYEELEDDEDYPIVHFGGCP